jgi:hypothetical protein
MTAELSEPLARYADRFHAVVGDRHHVASPLGAWLLLGLCSPASAGAMRDEFAEVLGTDPASVAAAAAALLDNPHPLVPSASAVWLRCRGRGGRRGRASTRSLCRQRVPAGNRRPSTVTRMIGGVCGHCSRAPDQVKVL